MALFWLGMNLQGVSGETPRKGRMQRGEWGDGEREVAWFREERSTLYMIQAPATVELFV